MHSTLHTSCAKKWMVSEQVSLNGLVLQSGSQPVSAVPRTGSMYKCCTVLRLRVHTSCRACVSQCAFPCASRRCSQPRCDLLLNSSRAHGSKKQYSNRQATVHSASVDNPSANLQPEQLDKSKEYLKLVLQQNVSLNLTGGLLQGSFCSSGHLSL